MAPSKLISTSQGFQDSKGTVVANGMLMLQLSQTCTVTASGGQVTTEPIYLNLDSSGKITSTAIWFNDELSPSGTIYYGTVYASNKTRMIPGLEKLQYSITGASFDLATAVQSGSASPSFSGAVLLTPAGNQVITTGNLTLTTGQFIETANAVTGTNGLVRKTSPTLTTPDIGVATATSVNKVALTAPASSATLTIANGKTLTANNSLTLAGTDSTTQTFPASPPTGGTIAYGNPKSQQFTSNGTFTIPTGVTAVKVTIIGGGGAGGGSTAANNGGGGGSGGIAIKFLSGITPANTIAVTVGAGGTGVSAAGGNNGSASSIASGTQTITTVTANGGSGGASSGTASAGGNGGAVSTNGDINGAGAPGANSSTGNLGGWGGATFLGGPGGTAAGAAGNAAVANTGSGGGGGGASGNAAGGNGAAGLVIFEWVT